MAWAQKVVLFFVAIVLVLAAGLWVAGMRAGAGRNEIVVEINKPAAQVFPWLIEP
jgi:predicted small integral membrane protein